MILFPKRYSAEYSFPFFFFIQHQWIERKMLWLRYHKSSHMKPLDYFVCVWWRERISVNNVLNFGHKTIKRLEIKHACCLDWFCVVSFLEYFSYFLLEQQVNKTEQSVSCVWVCFTFLCFSDSDVGADATMASSSNDSHYSGSRVETPVSYMGEDDDDDDEFDDDED